MRDKWLTSLCLCNVLCVFESIYGTNKLKTIEAEIDKQIKENHNKIENTELEEDTLKLMSANRELAREKDRLREKFSEIEIE